MQLTDKDGIAINCDAFANATARGNCEDEIGFDRGRGRVQVREQNTLMIHNVQI